jgi:hypothetical protein
MFMDAQVMKYVGGTLQKEKNIEGMEMRRGRNGCIGVWCICDLNTGKGFGSTTLMLLPMDKDDTRSGVKFKTDTPDRTTREG